MAALFDYSDTDYWKWLAAHPDGFVLNTGRGITPKYRVIHKASCRAIQTYTGLARSGGFTERQYVKLCGDSIEDLHIWLRHSGHADEPPPRLCHRCNPS